MIFKKILKRNKPLVIRGKSESLECTEKNLFWYDWIIFGVAALFCAIFFGHLDLIATAERSLLLLSGHVSDFYSASLSYTGDTGANYLPTTFLLFAIWNIPLKLFGFAPEQWLGSSLFNIYWYKLLLIILYLLSGYLLFRITRDKIGMSQTKARIVAYIFMTSPLAFFSQFFFCQYDIFTVFFMIAGLWFYFEKNMTTKHWILFCLFFGLAVSCKYYAILIFAILLVLRNKDVKQIFLYSCIALAPLLLEAVFYILFDGTQFKAQVIGFPVIDYVKAGEFNIGFASIRVMPLFLCVLLTWALFVKPKDYHELVCYAFYFCGGICFAIFSLMNWHPQWLIFGTVFWTVSTCMNKRFDFFMLLDTLCILLFYIFVVNIWIKWVDQGLLRWGYFKPLLMEKAIDYTTTMASIYPITVDVSRLNLIFTVIVAVFLVNFIFKHPKFCQKSPSEPIKNFWVIRLRFLVAVLAFAIPAFMCLPSMLDQPDVLWSINNTQEEGTTKEYYLSPDDPLTQSVTLYGDEISKISIMTLQNSTNPDNQKITLKVIDKKTKEIIADCSLNGSKISNGDYTDFILKNAKIKPGSIYLIRLELEERVNTDDIDTGTLPETQKETVGIYTSLGTISYWEATNKDYSKDYLYVNNNRIQDYRFIMKIYD